MRNIWFLDLHFTPPNFIQRLPSKLHTDSLLSKKIFSWVGQTVEGKFWVFQGQRLSFFSWFCCRCCRFWFVQVWGGARTPTVFAVVNAGISCTHYIHIILPINPTFHISFSVEAGVFLCRCGLWVQGSIWLTVLLVLPARKDHIEGISDKWFQFSEIKIWIWSSQYVYMYIDTHTHTIWYNIYLFFVF